VSDFVQSGDFIERHLSFPESVRLLWEATETALQDFGLDYRNAEALAGVIVRLADERISFIDHHGRPGEHEDTRQRLLYYRDKAAKVLAVVNAPRPDLDFEKLAAERAAS
jgi:hypothetical protein